MALKLFAWHFLYYYVFKTTSWNGDLFPSLFPPEAEGPEVLCQDYVSDTQHVSLFIAIKDV